MENTINEVFVIVDADGKIWSDSVNTNERSCKINFARQWFAFLKNVNDYDALNVWRVFESNGWKVKSLSIQQNDEIKQ